MNDTRVTLDLRPGDVVRTLRETRRSEVPAGSTGTFLRYESIPDMFGPSGARRTVAVVRFACRPGETVVSPNVLAYTVNAEPSPWERAKIPGDPVREAQKHADLAAAHERVARALDDLRRVEESYR